MNLLEHFPDGFTPRKEQETILKEIGEYLDSGYKKIILSAPTGIGKSLVAVTLARALDTSFIVTNSKHLQDQYVHDIPHLVSVKGKSNYACLKTMKRQGMEGDRVGAVRMGMTCEKGECVETVQKDGKKTQQNCKLILNKLSQRVLQNSTLRFSGLNGERGTSTIATSSGFNPMLAQNDFFEIVADMKN